MHLKSILNLKTQLEQLELELEAKKREVDRVVADNKCFLQESFNTQDKLSNLAIENQDLVHHIGQIKQEYEQYKDYVKFFIYLTCFLTRMIKGKS